MVNVHITLKVNAYIQDLFSVNLYTNNIVGLLIIWQIEVSLMITFNVFKMAWHYQVSIFYNWALAWHNVEVKQVELNSNSDSRDAS